MRAKLVSESQNFKRGLDPKTAMEIGILPPYPKMSIRGFDDWYQREIAPYYDIEDLDIDSILHDVVNDEQSLEEELRTIWKEEYEAPDDLIEKLISAREYFWHFEYIKNL